MSKLRNGVNVMIVVANMLLFVLANMSIHPVNAAEKCEKTVLYPLTNPIGKPEATILCHPIGAELQQQNNQNILFNSGLIASQHSTFPRECPSKDKSYCSGWDYANRFLK